MTDWSTTTLVAINDEYDRAARREAEANVDARIGWVGENPVDVPHAR